MNDGIWSSAGQALYPLHQATLNNVIDRIAIAGYRSIRSIILRLGQLNVVTVKVGPRKSNLYRALRLLADAADGRLAESLATWSTQFAGLAQERRSRSVCGWG